MSYTISKEFDAQRSLTELRLIHQCRSTRPRVTPHAARRTQHFSPVEYTRASRDGELRPRTLTSPVPCCCCSVSGAGITTSDDDSCGRFYFGGLFLVNIACNADGFGPRCVTRLILSMLIESSSVGPAAPILSHTHADTWMDGSLRLARPRGFHTWHCDISDLRKWEHP